MLMLMLMANGASVWVCRGYVCVVYVVYGVRCVRVVYGYMACLFSGVRFRCGGCYLNVAVFWEGPVPLVDVSDVAVVLVLVEENALLLVIVEGC